MANPIPEKTAPQQRGRPFKAGQSGNPAGRPKGARNRATLAAEALLDGEAEALTRKAISMALEGDPTALRICMERLLPPRKERAIQFSLPPLDSADDAQHAIRAIIEGVANGQISPSEATAIMGLVDAYRRTAEAPEPIPSPAPVIHIEFVAPDGRPRDSGAITLVSDVAPAGPLLAPPRDRSLL
jgi:hypothetical protein